MLVLRGALWYRSYWKLLRDRSRPAPARLCGADWSRGSGALLQPRHHQPGHRRLSAAQPRRGGPAGRAEAGGQAQQGGEAGASLGGGRHTARTPGLNHSSDNTIMCSQCAVCRWESWSWSSCSGLPRRGKRRGWKSWRSLRPSRH